MGTFYFFGIGTLLPLIEIVVLVKKAFENDKIQDPINKTTMWVTKCEETTKTDSLTFYESKATEKIWYQMQK